LKLTIWTILTIIGVSIIPFASAEELEIFTNSDVYSDGQPLLVYGKALSNENLILRLFAPDGTIAKFDQVIVGSDGTFDHILLTWPTSSTKFPYGTYTIEAISTTQNGLSRSIDIKFTSTSELIRVPVERHVSTLVFAPEVAAINKPFRVFVQVSSDGLLVGGNPNELLSTSHVHPPSGEPLSLSQSFQTLHEGLYYIDYVPLQTGTYVFHMVAFSKGTVAHGSSATSVLSQDISGVAEQVVKLNTILDETSGELDRLKTEIEGFGTTLEGASKNIDSSVSTISSSVSNIEEASGQLNSLLFPIVASIGIIVALQIAIFARRR
jgi:tetrahydromethanopterin S-methyltransferase subunit B